MNLLKGLLGNPHDLITGDCWQIAAGVVIVLAGCIALLQSGIAKMGLTNVVLGVVIMVVSAFVIYNEARSH